MAQKHIDELRNYFLNTSDEQLEKDWNEIKEFNNVGPSVEEYVEFVSKKAKEWTDNIDLAEILEGCPKWTPLYSTKHGKVLLKCVGRNQDYPIVLFCPEKGGFVRLTRYGTERFGYGPCILFPSKDQLDWNDFVIPKNVPYPF